MSNLTPSLLSYISAQIRLPNRPASIKNPSINYMTQYPYTGSSVMLMLKPENSYNPEIMVFGGQNVNANSNLNLLGCSESLRIAVTLPTAKNSSYGWGAWVTEFMGSPRVMPDSVLLPNGVVILLNGAQAGLAGDSSSGGLGKASLPNFYAEMYNPDATLGQRWSTLARSQIARLYHSTAALTTNGTILVTGCDRCTKIVTDLPFSAPAAKAEYRNEIFYPPFWFDFANKPAILSSPSAVTYGSQFTVTYSGPNVTYAVLVAPSSTTHCFNTNQRVVKLATISSDPYNQRILLRVSRGGDRQILVTSRDQDPRKPKP